MRITVATNYRLDTAKRLGDSYTQPETKSIDWNDSSDRKWLQNHLHWAMHNGREVRLIGPAIIAQDDIPPCQTR